MAQKLISKKLISEGLTFLVMSPSIASTLYQNFSSYTIMDMGFHKKLLQADFVHLQQVHLSNSYQSHIAIFPPMPSNWL